MRAGTIVDADTFWQVRTGLLTIAHKAIPTTDPFSWTMHGQPWTQNSWGFDVLIAGAYRLAGLPGVAWTCVGLVMVTVGLALFLCRELGASAFLAGTLLLLASPLLIAWLPARPQLVDYAAVLILTILLRRIAAGRKRVRAVMAVGIASVVWANLHAGALLGAAMIFACVVLLAAKRELRASGWCLAAGVAALAGSFINPYGVGILRQAAQVQSASAGLVVEWRHLDPSSPAQCAMLALGLGALILALRRRDVIFVGVLGVASAAGIFAIRMLPILVLVALPVLAASALRTRLAGILHRRRIVLYLGLAVAVVLAVLDLSHIGRPEPALYSMNTVRDIPSHCRLFNSYDVGGFVILERPDVQVSLDSRNDLYGRERVLADEKALAGRGDVTRELAGAGCVLVPPATGLANWLRSNPGWKLTASDSAGALFVRVPYFTTSK